MPSPATLLQDILDRINDPTENAVFINDAFYAQQGFFALDELSMLKIATTLLAHPQIKNFSIKDQRLSPFVCFALLSNKALTDLRFIGTRFTLETMEAFAKGFSQNTTLKRLSFRENFDTPEIAATFFKTLPENRTLKTLECIPTYCDDLWPALAENKGLETLGLYRGYLSRIEINCAARVAEMHPTLSTLSIVNTGGIDSYAKKRLAEVDQILNEKREAVEFQEEKKLVANQASPKARAQSRRRPPSQGLRAPLPVRSSPMRDTPSPAGLPPMRDTPLSAGPSPMRDTPSPAGPSHTPSPLPYASAAASPIPGGPSPVVFAYQDFCENELDGFNADMAELQVGEKPRLAPVAKRNVAS